MGPKHMGRRIRELAAGVMLILALTGCESLGGGFPQSPPADPPGDEEPPADDEEPLADDDGACPTFPADSFWHADVSELPVHENSQQFIESIGAGDSVHPDFGAGEFNGGPIGIPVTSVPPNTPGVEVDFDYAGESDAGPYPIPDDVAIESGGDRHIILHDPAECRLYELFAAEKSGNSWRAGSGAIFDLRSNELRPEGWTSADAAGLAILPGLVQYDEVADGSIDHAIRVTVPRSRDEFIWPARHAASNDNDPALPPMGLRLRLKSSVDISGLPEEAQEIARAMQTYGLIVADNGSPWYISGTPDERWNDDALRALGELQGSDFEAVDTSSLMADPDSGAVNGG